MANNEITVSIKDVPKVIEKLKEAEHKIKELEEYKSAVWEIERYINAYSPYFLETQEENNKHIANIIHKIGNKEFDDEKAL